PRRPGHGPAGSSFWERAGGEVGRRAAQDLVLLLQPALLAAQLDQLVLLAGGLAVHDTVVDVGLAHPAPHRLGGDTEVGGDLGVRQIATAGDPHDITLELRRKLLGHSDILPAGPRPTDGVSTSPAAVPHSTFRNQPHFSEVVRRCRKPEPTTGFGLCWFGPPVHPNGDLA